MSEAVTVVIITGCFGLVATIFATVQFFVNRYDKKKEAEKKVEEDNLTQTIKELKDSIDQIKKTNELQSQLLIGLGHDKIVWLGKQFLKQGYIDSANYASLKNIFEPYAASGGNGEAHKIFSLVEKLPIRDD